LRLAAELVRVPLRAPILAAHGELTERELVLVTLIAPDGLRGHGEAAPLHSYDGVSTEQVLAELRSGQPVCAPARAALDLARHDLQARRAGVPLWRQLGCSAPPAVECNATIAAADRAGAATQAAAARSAGFGTVKVKVGLGDDAGRVAAVRAAAGPQMQIRLDANGAWTVEEAIATLAALAPVGIECCEEPCHGLEANAAVAAAVPISIALDESARLPGALEHRYADAVALKVAGGGGITATIEAARQARAAGYDVYLASTFDGPLGIAAALHAAASFTPDRACGLATLAAFDRPDPLPPQDGRLNPPAGNGLGDGLIDWYRG
jgi:L-alanine-DL-glutamate epimerase-like enolase superfamily enzyme